LAAPRYYIEEGEGEKKESPSYSSTAKEGEFLEGKRRRRPERKRNDPFLS